MFTKYTFGMNHVQYVPYSFWYEFHTFVLTVYVYISIMIMHVLISYVPNSLLQILIN